MPNFNPNTHSQRYVNRSVMTVSLATIAAKQRANRGFVGPAREIIDGDVRLTPADPILTALEAAFRAR